MNEQTEKQEIVAGNKKLIEDLGRAIENVDVKLLDIIGGVEADNGDVVICQSRCA